jgi:hypothetical protein
MFGFTEEQISDFGMTVLVPGLMLLMIIIVGNLAYKSKAGKIGTFALFFALCFGLFGFTMKFLIEKLWGI